MAHQGQRDFVRLVSTELQSFFRDARVLEVGSLNINGSVRDFFSNCSYVGIDIAPGKDVDVVCQGQEYAAADGSFDQVISCEAMEHNPHWKETFDNMVRICRPGACFNDLCDNRSPGTWHDKIGTEQFTSYHRTRLELLPQFNSEIL